jgi:hypothetical protein
MAESEKIAPGGGREIYHFPCLKGKLAAGARGENWPPPPKIFLTR